MKIRIKDRSICGVCQNKICAYSNSVIKENFHGLRSETTVCPVSLLQESPLDLTDTEILDKKECISCGLCELSCSYYKNLDCEIEDYLCDNFLGLTEQQYNAIACSYLHYLIGFSANTNRNKSLQFDGYVSHDSGEEAFVEVDYNDDSLESVRRLLGDRLLYSPSDREIKNGVVVLKCMPQKGSRDVYNLLENIKKFPTTKDMNIYVTTFSILRLLALNLQHAELTLSEVLFNVLNETDKQYVNKISQWITDGKILRQLEELLQM